LWLYRVRRMSLLIRPAVFFLRMPWSGKRPSDEASAIIQHWLAVALVECERRCDAHRRPFQSASSLETTMYVTVSQALWMPTNNRPGAGVPLVVPVLFLCGRCDRLASDPIVASHIHRASN